MIIIKLLYFLNVQYFLRKTEITSVFFFPLNLDSPALWIYYDFLLLELFLTGGTAPMVDMCPVVKWWSENLNEKKPIFDPICPVFEWTAKSRDFNI